MVVVPSLDAWFQAKFDDMECSQETRAYLSGIFSRASSLKALGTGESFITTFAEAKHRGDFGSYQNLADWIFWCDSYDPETLNSHRELAVSVGRLSYYACYRLLQRRWLVYQELADDFVHLSAKVRKRIVSAV